MPGGSYKMIDPKLVKDSLGEFHLQTGSPAANAAERNYTFVTTDMDGQKRIAPFDTGADEISKEKPSVRILNPVDVGAVVQLPK
jgi:hypothetical protein